MDFGKSQLEKHGWTKGKGLGRHETGMQDAIKVKLKFDTSGVGHNMADEHTYHWWDHAFNKAVGNIKVDDSGPEIKVTCEEELQLSTKKPLGRAMANKDLLYGRFIKSGLLSDGNAEKQEKSESESEDEEDNTVLSTSQHTDEQLFKICGGLTAHKGARHGLNASAKLSRVEKQEAEFMAKWAPKENEMEVSGDKTYQETVGEKRNKKKKKKSKKEKTPEVEVEIEEQVCPSPQENGTQLEKTKKKIKKSKDKSIELETEDIAESKKTKKRKMANGSAEDSQQIENTECGETSVSSKKKKKRDKVSIDELVNNKVEDITLTKVSKKKKKSKSKDL